MVHRIFLPCTKADTKLDHLMEYTKYYVSMERARCEQGHSSDQESIPLDP